MGFFSKPKNRVDEVQSMNDHIQFQLNNNSNIEIERKVFANVRFPYNDMLETINLVMMTTKGIFIFIPLYTIGEYIGGRFESIWMIGDRKISNPIEIQKNKTLALASFLKVPSNKIIPYIILNNNSIVRDIPYCTKEYRIVRERDLYYFLGFHTSILPDVFEEIDLLKMKNKLNKSDILKELFN